jgi:Ion transport protein
LEKLINHWTVTIFMTVWTIYALFGDDVRQLGFPKAADKTFYSLTICAMIFFAIEILLASIAKEDYFLSFYFWLDLISTVSLIFDIGWFWDAILGTGGSVDNAKQAQSAAKAGRGARIGTRASRIARVVRLIRLIRIVKLYKNANTALERETANLLEEN